MSSTRKAVEGSPLRQERYMSSAELQRGLLSTCVASRCRVVGNAEHRKLIWFLQSLSHQFGGLERVAREIVDRWPERIGTKSMFKFGMRAGQIYSAEQVRAVRREIEIGTFSSSYPLRGEGIAPAYIEVNKDEVERRAAKANQHPENYPASTFQEACFRAASGLGEFLAELCLNPAIEISENTWRFSPRLIESLREYRAEYIEQKTAAAPVVTTIGRLINDSLDYAMDIGGLSLIEGFSRTGKTHAAEAWCAAHPGIARYVEVPPTSDDIGFFRAICEALGAGAGSGLKAVELREKIHGTLSCGDIMLVFDEAWRLWPMRNLRKAMPHRINWIMAELLNRGIPVAFVSTPQFTANQQTIVQHSGWSDEQLIGRLQDYVRLPDVVTDEDLEAVARVFLPHGCAKSIRILVTYALSSKKYLAGIESLAKRAYFMARRDGRETPTFFDLSEALKNGVTPSDNAVFAAISSRRDNRRRTAARAIKDHCSDAADTLHGETPRRDSAPAEETFHRGARTAVELLST